MQSTALSGLTDEQFNAIVEMSRNDENIVIGTKIGELHGKYDADVLESTGIAKNNGEKSYDYVKRVLGEYKGKLDKAEANKSELKASQAKIAELQEKLEKGGDATLVQQLKDSKTLVAQLQDQVKTNTLEFAKLQAQMAEDVKNVHVDYAFKSATQGLKFKAGITDNVKNIMLNSAKEEILAKGVPEVLEENGVSSLVFRDANGQILTNKKNNLNPYTLSELLMETSIADILETGKKQVGGGTEPNKQGNGTPTFALNAKTQVEATAEIDNYLLSIGLTRTSTEFFKQRNQLWNESGAKELPFN